MPSAVTSSVLMLSVVRVNVVAPNMIDTREKTKDNTEYMFGAWKKSTQIGVKGWGRGRR